jgi:hypothetical protein
MDTLNKLDNLGNIPYKIEVLKKELKYYEDETKTKTILIEDLEKLYEHYNKQFHFINEYTKERNERRKTYNQIMFDKRNKRVIEYMTLYSITDEDIYKYKKENDFTFEDYLTTNDLYEDFVKMSI